MLDVCARARPRTQPIRARLCPAEPPGGMAKTKIQWVEYVFNPWWGCVQVSPACDHCYAMVLARRLGQRRFGHPVEWGPDGRRGYITADKWSEPLAWDRLAAKRGARERVFCGSMMDVFEGLREQRPHLERL